MTSTQVDFSYSDNSEEYTLLGRFVSSWVLEDIIDEVVYGKTIPDAEDSDEDYDDRNDTCMETYESEDEKSELGDDFTSALFEDLLTDIIRQSDAEIIVGEILEDIIDNVVSPSAIVGDILNEMLVKIVPSEMGMPIVVIKATTISPEYFKKLKRTPPTPEPSPKRSLRKRRVSIVAEELDLNMEIKQEIVDVPDDQQAVDDEIDIKPVLPPPEELIGRTR